MAIKFSIAKRGLLPHEDAQQNGSSTTDLRKLRPQAECPKTIDIVEHQSGDLRMPSIIPKGELLAALDMVERVMMHELEQGNAVSLPGIGTFRLSLKGEIEVKDGYYHGKNVHVDGLMFRPDRNLLKKIQGFEVNQVPVGHEFQPEESAIEARLDSLFASKETITHKDIAIAFEQTLTHYRIVRLLGRLVEEGRLVREGKGAQTRYRLPK